MKARAEMCEQSEISEISEISEMSELRPAYSYPASVSSGMGRPQRFEVVKTAQIKRTH
jgi:hypothetical protein